MPHADISREARGLHFCGVLIDILNLGMWAAKALLSLNICVMLPEPLLLDNATSTKICWICVVKRRLLS